MPEMSSFQQSRNVLLTGSAWKAGFRNAAHDAAGPRPAGRIEKGQERAHHSARGCGGDRPDRAACSPALEALEGQPRESKTSRLIKTDLPGGDHGAVCPS